MSLKNELTRIDVHGYDRMLDYSNRGGGDLATLYDSTGDDVMRARSHKVNFWGPGFDILLRQWEDVVAHAENGGRNVAKFHDTSGDDLVGIGADWGKLSPLLPGKTDLLYAAYGFDSVKAYHSEGHDRAPNAVDFLMLSGGWYSK
jgi:hypothetical protein